MKRATWQRYKAHAKSFGYDARKVPAVKCLVYGKPIGSADYEPNDTLARFGQMLFVHARCR